MRVGALWRFPVKSLGGERLEQADLGPGGIPGDRGLVVHDGEGRLVTARTRPGLLGLQASYEERRGPLIGGRAWTEEAVAEAVREAAGEDARLVEPGPQERRFDETPLLVSTDGAASHLGIDMRRLRPNIVIEGVEGLTERDWPGRRLRIGGAVISCVHLCERCVMTTFDPDTQAQDPDVLRRINAQLGGRVALNCDVVEPGHVAVGDAAELL